MDFINNKILKVGLVFVAFSAIHLVAGEKPLGDSDYKQVKQEVIPIIKAMKEGVC